MSVQLLGAVYSAILLFLCFLGVHIFKLARIGYRAGKKLPPEKPKPPEEKKEAEPVYYIVEKKKKRAKTSYSEPKRITFDKKD